ncbi:MAG: FtsX-like permease family protein [Acidobacteriota bacterium]
MDWLRRDLRIAARALLRRPAFTILVVGTLAVGLSVNLVAWRVVDALGASASRFTGPGGAGWVFAGTASRPWAGTSPRVFDAVVGQSVAFEAVAAEGRTPLALKSEAGAVQVWALLVSPRYFDLVSAPLVAGRRLPPLDPADPSIPVVVSERFWRTQLRATPDWSVNGLVLNTRNASIVGIVADDFQGPGGLFEPDVWMPLEARRPLALPAALSADDSTWLALIARPKPGVHPAALALDLERIVQPLRRSSVLGVPGGPGVPGVRAAFVPFVDGHPEARALRPVAAIAMVAVGMVLLVACFNVAGLMLAKSADRRREFGLRAALGASRGQLIRHILIEQFLLAPVAVPVALLLATWSSALLSAFSLPAPIPQRLHAQTDGRAIAVGVVLSLVAALVPAIVPAWQVWRGSLVKWIAGGATGLTGSRAQARARRVFLVLQLAGSTVFLTLALLLGRGYVTLRHANPGFDAEHIAVVELAPAAYGHPPQATRQIVSAFLDRAAALPGVTAVSAADRVPFFVGSDRVVPIGAEGRDCARGGCSTADVYAVDARYMQTMGVAIQAGRMFSDDGRSDQVVINAAAATEFWPGVSPIGRSFRVDDGRMVTVVGIVGNMSYRLLTDGDARPAIFRPLRDGDFGGPVTIVVRTLGEPGLLAAPLREAIRRVDASLPPQSIGTMVDRLAQPLWPARALAGFLAVCGALATALAAVGLFGVTHAVVSQRTREFGVRAAIGASARALRIMVLAESLRLVAPGLALGVLLGTVVNALLRVRVLGIDRVQPETFAMAAALEVTVVIVASWLPARRAGRTDPLQALRAE